MLAAYLVPAAAVAQTPPPTTGPATLSTSIAEALLSGRPRQLGQKRGMKKLAVTRRMRLSRPPTFTKSEKRYPPGP